MTTWFGLLAAAFAFAFLAATTIAVFSSPIPSTLAVHGDR